MVAALVSPLLGLPGALVALLLGVLTFGAQATASPSHLPLAVGPADPAAAPALAPAVQQVSQRGGDQVTWSRVAGRADAQRLLDRKQVYGALLLGTGPSGPTATVLLSGAVNPSATQVAQPVLTQVGDGVLAAARAQAAARPGSTSLATTPSTPPPSPQVVTIHPVSAAGRILPLAASALLWVVALPASLLATVGLRRRGLPFGRIARLITSVSAAAFGAGLVLALARVWDSSITPSWQAIAFLALVGAAFALLQTGVLRWLGFGGVPLLVLLYLMAPAVAGTPPELLNPVYRELLWSWTPFRFSSEALRSLLFLGTGAPDIQPALWVFGGIGLAGLLLVLAPGRSRAYAA
ncbi:MAG: ABC transporter permease [Candidatus Dormibacteraeota bacterium]|nr:ABC transporter permease [Candidatus Dormibacteraeota bacterium]